MLPLLLQSQPHPRTQLVLAHAVLQVQQDVPPPIVLSAHLGQRDDLRQRSPLELWQVDDLRQRYPLELRNAMHPMHRRGHKDRGVLALHEGAVAGQASAACSGGSSLEFALHLGKDRRSHRNVSPRLASWDQLERKTAHPWVWMQMLHHIALLRLAQLRLHQVAEVLVA